MNSQKGVIHLAVPLLLLLIIGAVFYILISLGVIKNFLPQSIPQLNNKTTKKEPTVAVKTVYQNPFDKKSQYVNPFDQYKSPLLNLKK